MGEVAFFTTGGTLRPDSPSYVERAADRQLVEALLRRDFCYVLDSRQKGKSSLMARTIEALRSQGVVCAKLDLQRFGTNLDVDRWYGGLLSALGMDLGLTKDLMSYWGSNQSLGPLQRWVGALETVVIPHLQEKPLVIFVDEIDFVRSLAFSTDEFFAGIREMFNRRANEPAFRQVSFCLLGVATPSDLIQDVRITPFNIGKRIDLSDFTTEESAVLASGLGDRASADLARILYWTNGHPYLTQKLCAEAASAPTIAIDELVERLFFSSKAKDEEPNLRDVARRVVESIPTGMDKEGYLSGVLDLYQRVRSSRKVADDDTDTFIAVLKLSGLVGVVDGSLTSRNRIYERVFDREWIRTNMPDAEARRQRSAAMRAFVRTASVALLVLGCFAVLTVYALQSRARAMNAEKLANDRSDLLRQSLERERQAADNLRKALANERSARETAIQAEADAKKEAKDREVAQKLALTKADEARQAAIDANRARGMAQEETVKAQDNLMRANLARYVADVGIASRAIEGGDMDRGKRLLASLIPAKGEQDRRGFDWRYVAGQLVSSPFRVFPSPQTIVWSDTSHDNARVCQIDQAGNFRADDVETGRNLMTGQDPLAREIHIAASGNRVITVSPLEITAWDLNAHKQIRQFRRYGAEPLAISPDGMTLVISDEESLRFMSIDSGKQLQRLPLRFAIAIAFHPNGSAIAVSHGPRSLSLLIRSQDKTYAITHNIEQGFPGKYLSYSPNGHYIACAGADSLAIDNADGVSVYSLLKCGENMSAVEWLNSNIVKVNSEYILDAAKASLSVAKAGNEAQLATGKYSVSENSSGTEVTHRNQWDFTNQSRRDFNNRNPTTLVYSRGGRVLAIARSVSTVGLYEGQTRRHIRDIQIGIRIAQMVFADEHRLFIQDVQGSVWLADPLGSSLKLFHKSTATGSYAVSDQSMIVDRDCRYLLVATELSEHRSDGTYTMADGFIYDIANAKKVEYEDSGYTMGNGNVHFRGLLSDGRIVAERYSELVLVKVSIKNNKIVITSDVSSLSDGSSYRGVACDDDRVVSLTASYSDAGTVSDLYPGNSQKSVKLENFPRNQYEKPSFAICSKADRVIVTTSQFAAVYVLSTGKVVKQLSARWRGKNVATAFGRDAFVSEGLVFDLTTGTESTFGGVELMSQQFPLQNYTVDAVVLSTNNKDSRGVVLVGKGASNGLAAWEHSLDGDLQAMIPLSASHTVIADTSNRVLALDQDTGRVLESEAGRFRSAAESPRGDCVGLLFADHVFDFSRRSSVKNRSVFVAPRSKAGLRQEATALALVPAVGVRAIGFSEGSLLIYSAKGAAHEWEPPQPSAISSLAFSHNGTKLAVGLDNGDVWIADSRSGRADAKLVGHNSAITQLAFTPTGETLASGDALGNVKLWNAALGIESIRLTDTNDRVSNTSGRSQSACTGMRFSLDGTKLGATFADGSSLEVFAPMEKDLQAFNLPKAHVKTESTPKFTTSHTKFVTEALTGNLGPEELQYVLDEFRNLKLSFATEKPDWLPSSSNILLALMLGRREEDCRSVYEAVIAERARASADTSVDRVRMVGSAQVAGSLGDIATVRKTFDILRSRKEKDETDSLKNALILWRTSNFDEPTYQMLGVLMVAFEKSSPDGVATAITPGVLMLRSGRLKEGLAMLEHRVSAEDLRIRRAYLALAKAMNGRTDEARAYLEERNSLKLDDADRLECYLVERELRKLLKMDDGPGIPLSAPIGVSGTQ